MKITRKWLQDYLQTEADARTIADTLIRLGIEVEELIDYAAIYTPFVIGHIRHCMRHPNADRLQVCMVDIGQPDLIQVVCGAPNAREGLKTVFAPVGTRIPASGTVLTKGKIRDVESHGMLCSAVELGLGTDSEGIMELPQTAVAGEPIISLLGLDDVVFDLSLTPNRGDCFSVAGIAAELAAAKIGTARKPSVRAVAGETGVPLTVTVECPEQCPYFSVRLIKGVKPGRSSDLIRTRLERTGLKPLNNIIDVSNYVCHDLGQPLHAFDADKIKGNLRVHLSAGGESFHALNDKIYTLPQGAIVISDDTGIISLAGIMGGKSTACDDNTVSVLLEAAVFDPVAIALAGQALNLISDARTRFERGIDAGRTGVALEAATSLLVQGHDAGDAAPVVSSVLIQGSLIAEKKRVWLPWQDFERICGFRLSKEIIRGCLESLGLVPRYEDEEGIRVAVPGARHDINIAEDVVEEVLRLYGYEHIPLTPLPMRLPPEVKECPYRRSRSYLSAYGYQETVSYSFTSQENAERFNPGHDLITVTNPVAAGLDVMRPSLLTGLTETADRYLRRGIRQLSLFEIAPVYGTGYSERQTIMLAGLSGPFNHERHWLDNRRPADFYDAKAMVFGILEHLGLQPSRYQLSVPDNTRPATPGSPVLPAYYHPGCAAVLHQGKKIIAYLGLLHPQVSNAVMGTDQPPAAFEVFMEELGVAPARPIAPQSPFPPVRRDFAFIMPEDVNAARLMKVIGAVDPVRRVSVFDIFTGEGIDPGHKSVAVQAVLQSDTATLDETAIQTCCDRIIAAVTAKCGGVLRG